MKFAGPRSPMKTPFTILAVSIVAACPGRGAHDVDPGPAPVAIAPPAPRPAPGIDLAGPVPLPDRRAARRARGAAAPASLDLAADRAVVRVAVPVPPRGGSVGFAFGEERTGWVARIPDTLQLPAVAYGAGRVYVSGGFDSVSFYALDAETGRIEWATTNLEDNGPTAAVFDDGRVLFNTESCTLFALDARTGRRLWLRNLGDPTLAQVATADGLVYASHPGAGGQELTAYRVTDGAPMWTRGIGAELLAAPVIAGDAVYATNLRGVVFRFARRTGKLAWARALAATTAPWIAGDELFVTRRRGRGEQQVVVAAGTGAVLREHDPSTGHYAGDVPDRVGALGDGSWQAVWAFEGSRPVVDRGVRYVAMGGEIRASDAATGELLWQRRSPGSPGSPGTVDRRTLGSVALAGSEVVIATRDGQLFGLDVDTGYTLWSYAIGHRVVAEPIIARGWLYASTADGYVVALQVGDRTLDGWHMFGGNPRHDGPVVD